MKKLLIGLAAAFVLTVLAVGVAVFLAGRDIKEPDVSDLALAPVEIAPGENAFTYFCSATNHLYWPTNATLVADYLNGKPVDERAVAELIEKNTRAIEQIARGLECRRCIAPEVKSIETLLPFTPHWLKMGKILAAKIRHDRLAGRRAEAADACINLLKFSDLVQADAEALIQYLVGIAIMDRGFMQTEELARDPATSPDELRRLSDTLTGLRPIVPGLIRAFKVEYRCADHLIEQVRSGEFGIDELAYLGDDHPPFLLKGRRIPAYFLQPNKTKLVFANFYREMIANAPLVHAQMQRSDVKETLGLEAHPGMALLVRPNGVGKILCALMIPAIENVLERKCRTECALEAVRLLLAIELHRRETGELPPGLESLVPKYLPEVPRDPYDGRPFRYLPAKGILYSVGKDLNDSGGSTRPAATGGGESAWESRWKTEDAVFEISGPQGGGDPTERYRPVDQVDAE